MTTTILRRAFNRGPLPFEQSRDEARRIYAARLAILGGVVVLGLLVLGVVLGVALLMAWLYGVTGVAAVSLVS